MVHVKSLLMNGANDGVSRMNIGACVATWTLTSSRGTMVGGVAVNLGSDKEIMNVLVVTIFNILKWLKVLLMEHHYV